MWSDGDEVSKIPDRFLQVRTRIIDNVTVPLRAYCAGYEGKIWRTKQLSEHAIEWVPDFSLTHKELSILHSGNAVSKLRKAAKLFFDKKNNDTWGELGELLLHALIRQELGTIPLAHKLYFKSSVNETIKGFDCVHISKQDNEDYKLWLGEAKLYSNISNAIHDVLKEIKQHTETEYLKDEFLLINNKIEKLEGFNNEKIRKLFHKNTSLDEVFAHINIPVLLTYNSECIKKHVAISKEFEDEFEKEVKKHWQSFCSKRNSLPLNIYLFLLPLKDKKELVTSFAKELEKWQ